MTRLLPLLCALLLTFQRLGEALRVLGRIGVRDVGWQRHVTVRGHELVGCLAGLAFEVQATQAERLLRVNPLQGLAIRFAEHRAQRFMACHQGLEGSLQRGNVQFTAQVQAGHLYSEFGWPAAGAGA